jgi:hypothetical protein
MAREILFQGVKEEGGSLFLELCDTPISYKMDRKFWRGIAQQIERQVLKMSGAKEDPKYKEKMIDIGDVIEEGLRNWK